MNYIIHAVKERPAAHKAPDGSLNDFDTPNASDNVYSLAARRDELEKLEGLPAEVLNRVDSFGNTLLVWAADGGALSVIEFLLRHNSEC